MHLLQDISTFNGSSPMLREAKDMKIAALRWPNQGEVMLQTNSNIYI